MITYDKLFTLLQERGLNKVYLRNNGFNPNTVDQLVKNKDVKISTINKLCTLLDCTLTDILTYIPDDKN